jgi:hypothetical protein
MTMHSLTSSSSVSFMAILTAYLAMTGCGEAQSEKDDYSCGYQLGQICHAIRCSNDLSTIPAADIRDKEGKLLLSWRVAILPFLEQKPLFDQFHLDEPWDSPHNLPLLEKMPEVYLCPTRMEEKKPTTTNYQVVTSPFGFYEGGKSNANDTTDGADSTIMVVESMNPVPWTKPDDPPLKIQEFRSVLGERHRHGVNALFANGDVRNIPASIPLQGFQAMLTRNGGERVPIDEFRHNQGGWELKRIRTLWERGVLSATDTARKRASGSTLLEIIQEAEKGNVP